MRRGRLRQRGAWLRRLRIGNGCSAVERRPRPWFDEYVQLRAWEGIFPGCRKGLELVCWMEGGREVDRHGRWGEAF